MHPTQIKTNCNRVQFKMKLTLKKKKKCSFFFHYLMAVTVNKTWVHGRACLEYLASAANHLGQF